MNNLSRLLVRPELPHIRWMPPDSEATPIFRIVSLSFYAANLLKLPSDEELHISLLVACLSYIGVTQDRQKRAGVSRCNQKYYSEAATSAKNGFATTARA